MKGGNLEWNVGEKRRVFTSPIFSVDLSERTHEEKKGEFVTLALPNWVTIIPLIEKEDGENVFLMERQYRHGSESVTMEFPAGLVEENECAEEGAKRELMEETGYEGDFEELCSFNPNPAFMTNTQTIFLARNLRKKASQSLDENEEIELEEVEVESVIARMGEGVYSNGVMLSAHFAFMRKAEEDTTLRRKK